jgi:hypothetical protein
MTPLAPEELTLLDILKSDKQARASVPGSEQRPVSRPEKYSFPIGVDDQGELFPVTPQGH